MTSTNTPPTAGEKPELITEVKAIAEKHIEDAPISSRQDIIARLHLMVMSGSNREEIGEVFQKHTSSGASPTEMIHAFMDAVKTTQIIQGKNSLD